MHRLMWRCKLKTGEEAEIWKVTAPDPAWKDRILPFLDHKGPKWKDAMARALEHGAGELVMNFYECVLPGQGIVGNITVLEALDRPVGLLQHVFTLPEQRRKGIASRLMEAVTHDFRLRGGRAMFLGTGYQSPPFWIYYSYGFRPIGEKGLMGWILDPKFYVDYFAPGPVQVRDVGWQDWPLLNALYLIQDGWYCRSLMLGRYGFSSMEGPFLEMMAALEDGRLLRSKVLTKEDGAVVGHAMLWVQRQFPGEPLLLDLFVHPNFADQAHKLIEAIGLPPNKKVQAVADHEAVSKQEALERAGLFREATFANHLRADDRWLDLHFYCAPWKPPE